MKNFKECIKEFDFLETKTLIEAFEYFKMGNPSMGMLSDNNENKIVKHHYIKQDLGHKFIYDCYNFAIKIKITSDDISNITICKYELRNDNEIIKSRINFDYNYIFDRVTSYNEIVTEFSCYRENAIQKVLK